MSQRQVPGFWNWQWVGRRCHLEGTVPCGPGTQLERSCKELEKKYPDLAPWLPLISRAPTGRILQQPEALGACDPTCRGQLWGSMDVEQRPEGIGYSPVAHLNPGPQVPGTSGPAINGVNRDYQQVTKSNKTLYLAQTAADTEQLENSLTEEGRHCRSFKESLRGLVALPPHLCQTCPHPDLSLSTLSTRQHSIGGTF